MSISILGIRNVLGLCRTQNSAVPLIELLGCARHSAPVTKLPDDLFPQFTCAVHFGPTTLAAYRVHVPVLPHAAELARAARMLRAYNEAQLQLYVFVVGNCERIVLGSYGLGERLQTLTLDPSAIRASEAETILEMVPAGDEVGTALAARYGRALDRARISDRFFSDFAAQRDMVAHAWLGLPGQSRRDREHLSLLLLSRLMFLYFLQHRDQLGDRDFLLKLLHAWQSSPDKRGTFYSQRLKRLFFHVLNRRPEKRPPYVRPLGNLPYLNGGLFDRHLLERRHRKLDLPDDAIACVLTELLERYRFTTHEAADARLEGVEDLGIDPEMLGRVFEGLMADKQRAGTGTFYTPSQTVDGVVRESVKAYLSPRVGAAAASSVVNGDVVQLDIGAARVVTRALENIRILDPACGSGAFLLGSLAHLAQLRAALEHEDALSLRRSIVARNLYGVDLQSDAAQLCALRLWLALVPERQNQHVQPLPNLDRQVRQGDSLIDPLDLRTGATNTEIRRAAASIKPLGAAYSTCEPEQRAQLNRRLRSAERQLTRAWLAAERASLIHQIRELEAAAREIDLFGEHTAAAQNARRELPATAQRLAELKRLARRARAEDEHPFFSFGVHFADASLTGFDLIVCNPPWVRAHRWRSNISPLAQRRFKVCDSNSSGVVGGRQVDLALLFLERSIELLAPGGVIGILLPAKFLRSLSGAAARRVLLQNTELLRIEDHSLDQHSIFEAAAFTTIVVARKTEPAKDAVTRAVIVKRGSERLEFDVPTRDLPLLDERPAPWLIASPHLRRALRRMQEQPLLGASAQLTPRRGIVSGANDVLVLERVRKKLSGLSEIRAQGYHSNAEPAPFEAIVESDCIAPLVRGCDVQAWSYTQQRFILCNSSVRAPRRALQYLARHNCRLPSVQRTTTPMVAWHDLASNLNAIVLPPGTVALNTVYFIPLEADRAQILCAYFNSLPVRTFMRLIAERAKDAHYRFFGWTMSLLPLPSCWQVFEAPRLLEIARAANSRGGIAADEQDELDAIVARAYALERSHVQAIAAYDRWLRK